MKILVVSNCYPPYFVGGYELGCRDVVDRLKARGHEVEVLTSVFGTGGTALQDEPHVRRVLNLAIPQLGLQDGSNRNLLGDCLAFSRAVRCFSPDIVYFWSQSGLCLWLAEISRLLGCRCAFFLSDTSFTSWRTRAFLRRWTRSQAETPPTGELRHPLRLPFRNTWLTQGRPIIQDQPCHFASRFLLNYAQRAKIQFSLEFSIVAHWGIDFERFRQPVDSIKSWPPQRFLYVGQLIREKGIHTAIEAFALLLRKAGGGEMSFTVVGGSTQPEYELELRQLTNTLGIAQKVHFLGKVPRDSLPAIYREHDVLVLPSIWDEPFAITPLEAMAARLPVVGTTTGGSGELLEDEFTAMVFQAGDAEHCARALERLCSRQELFQGIRSRAFELVASRHTLDHMVDRIEKGLVRIVTGNRGEG